MSDTYLPIHPSSVYAVEISGICNLTRHCVWCPMETLTKRKHRPRGIMTEETLRKVIGWIGKLDNRTHDPLFLHGFGEPLLHPEFEKFASELSRLSRISFSTNCTCLDEQRADRLAKLDWAWISLSPWVQEDLGRASVLLRERNIAVAVAGKDLHNWAGQVELPNVKKRFTCSFAEGEIVIRWDGTIVNCCITDRAEDAIGTVDQDPSEICLREYDICRTCHHTIPEIYLKRLRTE